MHCSVYPRWRGEHFLNSSDQLNNSGLSPLARGTLPLPVRRCSARRFIPAGAGKHCIKPFSTSCGTGLSPLARGTLAQILRIMHCLRFIPAGAGNTVYPAPDCWWITVYPRWRGEHT
ncbi:hypothetical protein SEEM054_07162, partial [Salmonella enterica subsp. enterica serovar Montevideo str. NC_MB110209-0054]